MTITGTGFTGATAVDFGTTAATDVIVVNATTITADSPAGAGTVNVTVISPAGTSATSPPISSRYTAAAAPTVTGISPASGPAAGGTLVTITGTGFTGATAVDFGTTAATGVTVVSATTITADSPAGTGTVDVTVISPAGTSPVSPADQFKYVAVPPKVMSVTRFGFHMRPTTLVIQFDGALDAASAQNVKDYTIIGPGGRPVRITSAVYNPTDDTVTLKPKERINLHHTYRLKVVGTGPGGVMGDDDILLDGAGNALPGSDYVASLTWRNLVLTPAEARRYAHPTVHPARHAGALAHRFIGEPKSHPLRRHSTKNATQRTPISADT